MAYRSYAKVHTDQSPDAHAAAWDLPAICAAYELPQGTARGGAIIDIGELGGAFDMADIEAFCAANKLPAPTIETIGTPQPDPGGADVEVALDIQVAAAVYSYATGQPAHIRVRFLPNAAGSIAQGISDAAAAGSDVMSWSWGEDERRTGRADCEAINNAAVQATATGFGMATVAASGDNGSSDGDPGANVDCPASCPFILGVGGTRKPHSGSEVVWHDGRGEGTGGGYSAVFPAQNWQIGAHPGPGRMVPDVAAVAAPETGYRIVVGGQWLVVGGTSGAAPFWAGLIAAAGPKPGWVNPTLWSNPASCALITKGNNGQFRAGPYPNPCAGLGVPIGRLVAGLKL